MRWSLLLLGLGVTGLPGHAAESDPALLPPYPAGAPGIPSRDPQLDARPGFTSPPPGYGEVPFWWWQGDPLTRERIVWQLDQLQAKGVSGLQVNYAHGTVGTPHYGPTYPTEPPLFSPAWWELWQFTVAECRRRHMPIGLSDYTLAWAGHGYWTDDIRADPRLRGATLQHQAQPATGGQTFSAALPAGTVCAMAYPLVGGRPNGQAGVDLRDLVRDGRLTWPVPPGEWQVITVQAVVSPHSIDPMNPEVGRQVVARWFQPFEDHSPGLGARGLNYFFSDELTFGVSGHLWTARLPEEFARRKGYDLLTALPALFVDLGPRTAKVRLDYTDVTMALTEEGYFRPTFDWQQRRGMIYACDPGSRGLNPREFGDYFRATRWYTAPGHDTPGLGADLIKGKVSSSIAHLYQRPRVWLEGYHSSGWGTGLAQITAATRENLIFGCNLVNLHGLYYSTHGGFWEWAPPCFHFRMPYWDHMGPWLKYFERLSYLVSQGVHRCDVAIMYPVAPLEAGLGDHPTQTAFGLGRDLFGQGVDFDFIDHESLERARVADRQLTVSGEAYRVLVLPEMAAVRWSTLQQALAFYRAGGVVIAVGSLPEASDRAGSDDAELDQAVRELFGLTAAEAKAGRTATPQTNAAGGVGAFSGAAAAPAAEGVRRYPGGFEGRWVWSMEDRAKVAFKAVWQGGAGTFAARLCGDNHATLYVNGRQVAHTDDYVDGWSGKLALADGDVLTIDGRDDDAGHLSAGLFCAVVKDGRTVLGPEGFRYTLAPGADWRTSRDLTGLRPARPDNVHPFHRAGQRTPAAPSAPSAAIKTLIDRSIPRDFVPPGPAYVLHRRVGPRDVYLVMKVPRGAECFFRAKGRVELWDAWTGTAKPVHTFTATAEGTRVAMPLAPDDLTVLVFSPEPVGPAVEQTDLDEVLAVAPGRVRGLSRAAGVRTATVRVGDRVTRLTGTAPAPAAPMTLTGDWECELKPTLDNRFGDFRQPATPGRIGAEARTFRYAEETTDTPDWTRADLDDSAWATAVHGYGRQYYRLGPMPVDVEGRPLEEYLLAQPAVDPAVPVTIGAHRMRWQAGEFSWRYGVWDDPGEQGYHGLKELVSDQFICLGAKQVRAYDTVYGPEGDRPGRYYLWTTMLAPQAGVATVVTRGEAPSAAWVNGQRVTGDQVAVTAGANRVLLRYAGPGRGAWLLRLGEATTSPRTPLAMTWYDQPGVLRWDPRPAGRPVGWYRFTAPPGLRGLRFIAHGQPQLWVGGRPAPVDPEAPPRADGATAYRCRLPQTEAAPMVVAVRLSGIAGYRGGGALPEPVALDCGRGRLALGDWSQMGALADYSGGVWYRRPITLTPDQLRGRVTLDLGQVAATAEVRLNGRPAGTLVAPPWQVDLTGLAQPGENRLEVLVYSTLANHYRTIPSRYRGQPTAGLLGPVVIRCEAEVVLGE